MSTAGTRTLFAINPALDRAALARRFAERGRVQVRDVLTAESAREILTVLARGTPWGMAVGAGKDRPQSFRAEETKTPQGQQALGSAFKAAEQHTARGDYGFRFAHYPILTAVQEGWVGNEAHEILLEHINAPEFMALAREITGIDTLFKADGQATLYAPGHYLGRHIDSHVAEGWEVAYVLNFAREDWHPDWGGYLLFLDEDGDVVEGFRPRFNALNLFRVPTSHMVSYVPPFAPMGRMAVTGWLRTK
ncbi:MAG: 2OG-Fe(II) oxygenase family protein [Erythrobacter sp.]|uniref:2OG-Fe(II) oxygenase n=1 Tax=Erythrobacter sp. TaxID=1042 RepID=UPI0032EDA637